MSHNPRRVGVATPSERRPRSRDRRGGASSRPPTRAGRVQPPWLCGAAAAIDQCCTTGPGFEQVYDVGMAIELPSDVSAWLVWRAEQRHNGDTSAALAAALRELMAADEAKLMSPADPWAGLTAQAKARGAR
jgi:hypothetical protein